MIEFKAQVVGSEAVIARMTDAALGYSRRVPDTVHALGLALLGNVKASYLSGQALNVRSGRLRRSINEKFLAVGNTFSSSVGTNVAYARRWELGFSGVENVRAHMRMMTMAWGRPLQNPREVQVNPFTRNVSDLPRPFLQPALAEMKAEIRARLVTAIEGRL